MPNSGWKTQLHDLYQCHYDGRGGQYALADDLGVTRGSVHNWLHGKTNPLTGRPIEPNYENRLAIAELAAKKNAG